MSWGSKAYHPMASRQPYSKVSGFECGRPSARRCCRSRSLRGRGTTGSATSRSQVLMFSDALQRHSCCRFRTAVCAKYGLSDGNCVLLHRGKQRDALQSDGRSRLEAAMAAFIQALSRLSASTNVETNTLKVITIFCGAGLVVSLICMFSGLDLSFF
jgi:hypothetical protein